MTRHELNEVFLRTSFLQGANATYLAELHARYEQDPASLDPEWRAFFASLDDSKEDVLAEARGPSWARQNGAAAALPASPQGGLSEQQALAAARDTLGARMLIRAYRTRGHLAAHLDPLDLVTRREHPELKPKTYGFTRADYDRPIYIGGAFGLEFSTLRQMLGILKHTYSGHIGFEYMHISDPQQRAWIQDRIEGREVSFTAGRQEGDPEEADRGRGLRALPRREIYRHQALRPGRRRVRRCRRSSRSSSAAASSASARSSSACPIAAG